MSGPPLHLMVDPEAKPTAHHTPIPVPIHWQDEVKADLDRDVRLGILEPVPVGTPVTWCSKMVVAAKKSGKPRRTVDFQALNRHALRETHHIQPPFHQARSVPPNTYKTVMDAWNGYHSIPLHEDDRHLTTFITPWGRYRYCVAPQGYIASGDGYTCRFDEIVSDVPRKTKCVDNSLLWEESIADSFFHTVDYLDLCGHNGVTRAGVKYVLSNTNTNTNTKIWIFQIQIKIFCSTLIQIQIQIQIQIHRFKYKYKYVQPNISSETVQIQNRAILWIPRYMLMACVSLCLGDTWR